MSFRGLLRPGQGFKEFFVFRRKGSIAASGRPKTASMEPAGSFFAIISQASPRDAAQWKQLGSPITHTVLQRGTKSMATADDVLCLPEEKRAFLIKGKPHNPGELGHFLVYHVEEREDLDGCINYSSLRRDCRQHPEADGQPGIPGSQ